MYLEVEELIWYILFKISFERERFKRDFKPFPFSRFFFLIPKLIPFLKINTPQHPMSSQCFFAA